ncbi:hypothetical protein BO99DRAFT_140154 [Aspergillus violaceofuscus CBS 115571]|uniref:Uncharacterized protein n=1 Tax=Aspergillus violaceofuscus (strain CBS 115571) TaxID=1450538 RepID=A0A2V5H5P0_ASPV1|nr:hypothetical protein BO99DRAFT_140154 [Aspergillus violaceofuscus CBS 115571]
MLGIGLVSYSGSHASAFYEKYLDSEIEFQFPMSEGAGDDFISLRRVRLSCLHEYIGGPVWVFCRGNAEMTRERTLVTSVESMADLWGPLRRSYSREGLIVQIELERGTIVDLRPEAGKEETVSCHWFKLGEQLPESSFPFKDTAVLAIGSSSVISSTHTMATAQCHVGLDYRGLGPKLRETSEFTFLGVERPNWAADTESANVGFSKFVNMSAGVSFKGMPGRSMKSVLLFLWQDDYPDPQTLQVRIGLEISARTGNALRVPLSKLFRLENIQNSVKRVFPDQLSRPTDTKSFQDAFTHDFHGFLEMWSADAENSFLCESHHKEYSIQPTTYRTSRRRRSPRLVCRERWMLANPKM